MGEGSRRVAESIERMSCSSVAALLQLCSMRRGLSKHRGEYLAYATSV
jgi:hypothetical protein